MDWILAIASVASAVAAVLAWAAKLWWGKEFASAKDETIRAKDAQIELLRSEVESYKALTPMKIREYFDSVKAQLEEYNDLLKSQLEEAKSEIDDKQREIDLLNKSGEETSERVVKLAEEKSEIEKRAQKLSNELKKLQQRKEGEDALTIRVPRFDPSVFGSLQKTSQALGDALEPGGAWQESISRIAESLNVSMRTWQDVVSNNLLLLPDASKESIMESWFLSIYENPAERVPYESAEGGYQYFPNEPYDAREVMTEQFPDVDEETIENVVTELERVSVEWVRKDRFG